MPSVGVLATIINVCVLLTVVVVDRIIEVVVRNFAASRLRREHRAPVVHDSDTWLPNIPRSFVKYRKHPAILLTVTCALLLICSELVTELGVEVSQKCSPVKRSGSVIAPGDSQNKFTEVELGTTSFFLQTLNFLDGNMTRVPSGLPRRLKGIECIACMSIEDYPDITSGCKVTQERTYKPGDLEFTLVTTDGPFKTVAESMQETTGAKRLLKGRGDLTNNGMYWGSFVIYIVDNMDLMYLEYSNQKHLEEVTSIARKKENTRTSGTIRTPVKALRISCSTNALSAANLVVAVSIYRTIQMENTINPAMFMESDGEFQPLSPDDVYRAVLSMKVIDDALTQGNYFEYTSCGTYSWMFLLPIVICVSMILLLFVISFALGAGKGMEHVPYNSRTWFRHSRMKHGDYSKVGMRKGASGYFEKMFDEMVVLEEGRSSGMRVGLRTRDGHVQPLMIPTGQQGFQGEMLSMQDMESPNSVDEEEVIGEIDVEAGQQKNR